MKLDKISMSKWLNLRYLVKLSGVPHFHKSLTCSFRGSGYRLYGSLNTNYVVKLSRISSSYVPVHGFIPLHVKIRIAEDLKTERNGHSIGKRFVLAAGLAFILYECSQHMKGKTRYSICSKYVELLLIRNWFLC